MKKFLLLLLGLTFIRASYSMIVDVDDLDLNDPAVFGGCRSYTDQERASCTKTLDFSRLPQKPMAQILVKENKQTLQKLRRKRKKQERSELQTENLFGDSDQKEQEENVTEEAKSAQEFGHPWRGKIIFPEKNPVGSEELDQKLLEEVKHALMNPKEHRKFIKVQACIKAGADQNLAFDYIDANIAYHYPDSRAQSFIGNAIRYAINYALIESRIRPFGSCGNDACFLAEYVVILSAPQRMGTPREKLDVLSYIPDLLALCPDPSAHNMNGKKVLEVLGMILNRSTSTIAYKEAYKHVKIELQKRFKDKAFLKDILKKTP